MSPDCEQPASAADLNRSSADELDQTPHQSSESESKVEKSSRSTAKRQGLPTAPAKKRIKLERLADESRPSSFSSASLTPSPSPKGDQLNDSLIKENLLKENLIKDHLIKETNNLKENYLKDIQSKENLTKESGIKDGREQAFSKSKSVKNINRPDTPPLADLKAVDQLNGLPALLTPHPALGSLQQFSASNPLVNPDLLTSLQHQQQHQQLNSLAQLYSAGNAAAHLLSPNSMKNLKFSIDNILQQKPDQLKNGKFLQENANGLQLSKLHFQLQQHHLQLQKQHMQFKQQQQSNQANQSKSPLNENNESNDSTNFSSSMLNSSMVEESKSNLTSIWPGWAYCRSYADPASGNLLITVYD